MAGGKNGFMQGKEGRMASCRGKEGHYCNNWLIGLLVKNEKYPFAKIGLIIINIIHNLYS